VKVFFHLIPLDNRGTALFDNHQANWAVLRWRWLRRIGGMIQTGENRHTQRKISVSATSSTTNLTWTDPGLVNVHYIQRFSSDVTESTLHVIHVRSAQLHQSHADIALQHVTDDAARSAVLNSALILSVKFWHTHSLKENYGDIHSFIHSFCSLSYDRSVASSKASSPQGAIKCFLFQFTVSSLFLKAIQ
jgi:hypothetical protein